MAYCEKIRCEGCPLNKLPEDEQEQAIDDLLAVFNTYYHSNLRTALADGYLPELVRRAVILDDEAREWLDEENAGPVRDQSTSNLEFVEAAVERIITGKHDAELAIG